MNYIVVVCLAFSLINCKTKDNEKKNTLNESSKIDTLIKKIPLKPNGQPYFVYKYISILRNQLKLSSLENGFDSMQIRIWFPEHTKQRLVILSNTSGVWSAHQLIFMPGLNQEGYDTITSVKDWKLDPVTEWSTVMGKLFKLGITSLPHWEDIPGYGHQSLDGQTYSVEIATQKKYRIYSYQNLEDNSSIKEAIEFSAIIGFLTKEFNLNNCCDD